MSVVHVWHEIIENASVCTVKVQAVKYTLIQKVWRSIFCDDKIVNEVTKLIRV